MKKTQGQIFIQFWEKLTFPGKNNFSRKKFLFIRKNSDDLFFLVINSHFQIFGRHFQIVTLFRPKFTTELIEIRYFQQINPLSKNPTKDPRSSEKTQEPKIRSKNVRSWEKTQGVATLRRPNVCCRPE